MNKEQDNTELEITERQLFGMFVYYYFKEVIEKAMEETLEELFGKDENKGGFKDDEKD